MNTRNNVTKVSEIPENTKRLIKSEFVRRKRPGITEQTAKENATRFCAVITPKLRQLSRVLSFDASYIGEAKTTEWAKQDLKKLAASIKHFRAPKKEQSNVCNALLQTAWVRLGYPMANDLTPFDMLDMLANASEQAAAIPARRGKLPVSKTEAYMWGAVGRAFNECAGVKPTATPSGFFASVCEYIATGLEIDLPSRRVLAAALKTVE